MILPWDKLVTLALGGYSDLLERFFNGLLQHIRMPDPGRFLGFELHNHFDEEFANLVADLGMTSELGGMADPLASLTIRNVPIIKSWRDKYYQRIERYPRVGLWDGINFPSDTTAWRPVAEKAVEAINKWQVVPRREFDRMARKQRSQAWTITKINSRKTLETIRQSLAQLPNNGKGRVEWYKTVQNEFDKSRLGPAAAELVYRVTASRGWHEGMAKTISNPVVGQLFPYVHVITINDSRRSAACAMMSHSGLNRTSVYNRLDPAYIHNRTPRHFNCRCLDSYMTVRQAARLGVQEAIEWDRTGEKPAKFQFVDYFEVPMPKGWIPLNEAA